jgi:hypothetical protein
METITDRLNRRSLELNVSQADIIRTTVLVAARFLDGLAGQMLRVQNI